MGYSRQEVKQRAFDALIVGAGAAGLRAALELARAGRSVAVLCKEHALRAPTVGAWDGISAALGEGDDWRAHLADTLHAGDALCEQDAAEFMCAQAPRVVRELERWGTPFERGADGAPAQEVGSGHGAVGGDTVPRVCAAGERTGHAVLHTLWQQCLAAGCEFLHEWLALELLFTDAGEAAGVTALELASGVPYVLRAHAVLLAGGGGARAFAGSGAAFGSTGDVLGMVARAGIPLQDMEFWQFSPLALAGSGVLLGERCLAAGGVLLGGDGAPFMSRYAPQRGELACADVVARAAALEIAAGGGCGPRKDCVLLDLAPLGANVLRQRLPRACEAALHFAGVDAVREPVPVVPGVAFQIGGIPVNLYAQMCLPDGAVARGLYAAGECASTGAHGAACLGGNALLEALVFGGAAGAHMAASVPPGAALPPLPADALEPTLEHLNLLEAGGAGEDAHQLQEEIRRVVGACAGVLRQRASLAEGVQQLAALRSRARALRLRDASRIFNMERVLALETDSLLDVAQATLASAAARAESRGAHTLLGESGALLQRDDMGGRRHTLWWREDGQTGSAPVRGGGAAQERRF